MLADDEVPPPPLFFWCKFRNLAKGVHRLLSTEHAEVCLYLFGSLEDNGQTLLRVTELGAAYMHAHSSQHINHNFSTILGGGLCACGPVAVHRGQNSLGILFCASGIYWQYLAPCV